MSRPPTADFPEGAPFGDMLRQLRESAGLTQAALARRAGLDTSYISRLERSDGTTPRAETVSRLLYALGLAGATRDAFLAAAGRRSPNMAETASALAAPIAASAPGAASPSQTSPRVAQRTVDIETRRAQLEMAIREKEERLRAANSRVDDLMAQLGQLAPALESALATQRYVSHDVQEMLTELRNLGVDEA